MCDVGGDEKGCRMSGWCGRFALVAVLVSAGCGGSGEATAEGLAVTAREVAEVAFRDPERMYDLLSAECQSSIPAEEWAAQADATKSMMDAMFGGAEVTVTEVRTRAVTATSGEAAATISVGGQDMGGGDEFQSYVFEDGAWKLASCDSMLGGETTTVGVEVEAEASVQLEVGTDSSDATTTTAAEPVDTEVAVLLGVYVWDETSEAVRDLQVLIGATPDGNYGPKTREAHLAELNARGLATDNVPTAPQTSSPEPEPETPVNPEPESSPSPSTTAAPTAVSGTYVPSCHIEFDTASTWEASQINFLVRLTPDSAGNPPEPGVEYTLNYYMDRGQGMTLITAGQTKTIWDRFSQWHIDAEGNFTQTRYSSGDVVEKTMNVKVVGAPDDRWTCSATGSLTAP